MVLQILNPKGKVYWHNRLHCATCPVTCIAMRHKSQAKLHGVTCQSHAKFLPQEALHGVESGEFYF